VEIYLLPSDLFSSLNRVLKLSKRDWKRFGVALAAIANQLCRPDDAIVNFSFSVDRKRSVAFFGLSPTPLTLFSERQIYNH
jgi:hypothetical protein